MRILLTLVIGALGNPSYSPLLKLEGYGVGTWVKIGTPPQPYFLTPDFGSSKSRLFMDGSLSLMPYLEPRAPSSTWIESEDGTCFTDMMQIVRSVFESVPIELSGRELRPMDTKHVRGSHGRLGLGPDSIIAQSKVMALRRVVINYGEPRGPLIASAFGLFDALPEISENVERSIYPRVVRPDGWFLQGTLNLNGQAGSMNPVDIAIDVNTYPILIPRRDLHRLVVQLRLYQQPHGTHTFVSPTGNLMVPCDSEGNFMVDLRATIVAVSGPELELNLPISGNPGGVNPDTQHPVCISPFEVNMYDGTVVVNGDGTATVSGGEWRLNPLFIKNWTSVFMDARGSRLVIDRTPIQRLPVIRSLPALESMLLSRPRLEITPEGAFLVFPRALEEDEKGYAVESRFPWQGPDGSWTLSFPCMKGTEEGTGRFDVESFPNHHFEIPENFMLMKHSEDILRLPLIRVDPSRPIARSSRPRYSLAINTGGPLYFISLRPVSHNSHNRVYADRVGVSLKGLAADFKNLGLK